LLAGVEAQVALVAVHARRVAPLQPLPERRLAARFLHRSFLSIRRRTSGTRPLPASGGEAEQAPRKRRRLPNRGAARFLLMSRRPAGRRQGLGAIDRPPRPSAWRAPAMSSARTTSCFRLHLAPQNIPEVPKKSFSSLPVQRK